MNDYLLVSGARGAGLPSWARAWRDGPPSGWIAQDINEDMLLLRRATKPVDVLMVGDTLVIGRLDRSLTGEERASLNRAPFHDAARRLQGGTWGEYVLVRRSVDGRLSLYRDPGGALDAVTWRSGEVSICSSGLPPWIDAALPELSFDWAAIAGFVANPTLQTADAGLHGLHALAPGEAWASGEGRQLWRPADFISMSSPRRRSDPRNLAMVVTACVRSMAEGRVLVEVSGGLDSAVIAGCLPVGGLSAAVNYFVRDPQGDERPFARSVAARAGVELIEVEKREAPLDPSVLSAWSSGVRPALNVFDHVHDADIASRCEALEIDSLMTGQGGDDVFFQTPTPLIVADGFRHGITVGELCGLARWQSRSVYGLLASGLSASLRDADLAPRRPAYLTDWAWEVASGAAAHPWLDDLASAPPAKAMQVAGLANALIVKGASQRGSSAALRHPLLCQPVMEYCLGVSTPDLTRGRDRGLARQAFAGVVPEDIRRRVTKGRMSAHYGRALAGALREIRPLLLEGRLAGAGVVAPEPLETLLSAEQLIWRGGYGAIINLLTVELWVRGWRERIAGLKPRSSGAIQP